MGDGATGGLCRHQQQSPNVTYFIFLSVSRKVPESGNYTFFVARDDNCELWLQPERVELVEKIKDDKASEKLLLIKLDFRTDHNKWDK